MDRNQPEIPARYYLRMGEVLGRLGVDVAQILIEAGIDPAALLRPDAFLHLSQVERLVDAAIRHSNRTDISFELGKALKLTSHSIVGFAVLSSPTIAYALRLVTRYFRLIMPAFAVRYDYDNERLQLTFQPVWSMSPSCLVFHLETIAVAVHMEVRELLQQRMPAYDLYLSIPKPSHVALYTQLQEAQCHFLWESKPSLRMSFPVEITNRTLALADPAALHLAESRCRELVQGVMHEGRVSDWARMMVREASDGIPTLAELAHMLNLSTRTLDRYLMKEGMGYRQLSGEVRHEKALVLLAAQQMTVAQIAYELGYTDSANFTRAFRRKAGISPTQYQAGE